MGFCCSVVPRSPVPLGTWFISLSPSLAPPAAEKTSMAYTDRTLNRAGVRARREKSPIFCAGGTSLETCYRVNFCVPFLGRPLEL